MATQDDVRRIALSLPETTESDKEFACDHVAPPRTRQRKGAT